MFRHESIIMTIFKINLRINKIKIISETMDFHIVEQKKIWWCCCRSSEWGSNSKNEKNTGGGVCQHVRRVSWVHAYRIHMSHVQNETLLVRESSRRVQEWTWVYFRARKVGDSRGSFRITKILRETSSRKASSKQTLNKQKKISSFFFY